MEICKIFEFYVSVKSKSNIPKTTWLSDKQIHGINYNISQPYLNQKLNNNHRFKLSTVGRVTNFMVVTINASWKRDSFYLVSQTIYST